MVMGPLTKLVLKSQIAIRTGVALLLLIARVTGVIAGPQLSF